MTFVMKLRDRFWLWGHPEGRYNNAFGNTNHSRMTPMEACLYMGIKNTFMVPDGWEVNRRQYNKSFKTLRQVGWEWFDACENTQCLETLFEEACEFKNLSCIVFDDFVHNSKDFRKLPLDNFWQVQNALKNNKAHPMDMWMVLYTWEFGKDQTDDQFLMKYMEPFDGVIMWTWKESDVPLIPEKFEIFKRMSPNNRRMLGCYLYNFGENKQATGEAVKWQLDWYREKIFVGDAEGVVLHTNTMADLDYEAYDVACQWLEEHGDEELPE